MKTYELTDSQIRGIANLAKQEQGSLEGARAEACLMANLLEGTTAYQRKYGDDIYNFVRKSGWFSRAAYWMDNGDAGASYRKVVSSVLVDGKRTLPPYINEHDCFSDIDSATNNGEAINKRDRTAYRPGVTRIRNRYGSAYTFWCFPTDSSDPFGYTKLTDWEPNADDIINKAESYLGAREPSGDDFFIRYYNSITGAGFDMTVAWCAIFVTDVARLIGVSTELIPTFADCDEGKAWFLNRKRYSRSRPHGGSYVPKKGDIVFYSNRQTQSDSTHVGYVVSCTGQTMRAIEGNRADAVGYREIALTDAYIIGYGKVADYLPQTGEWDGVNIKNFISNLYTDEFYRTATADELVAWEKDIQENNRTPEEVQEIFRNSPEGRQAWVKMLYWTILHREAGESEVAAWVGAMERGESREGVMWDIMDSPEAKK